MKSPSTSTSKSETKLAPKPEAKASPNGPGASRNGAPAGASEKSKWIRVAPQRKNQHGIPDYRLEAPNFRTVEAWDDGKLHYNVEGDFSAPAPLLCESNYLDKTKSIEMYRYMLLNRRMETALENLFKQQKVIGGVYLGLGQEGCSVASAYALKKTDWINP